MGQDAHADQLLLVRPDVVVGLPMVCLMEAISAFDWKRIERNRLKDELDRQLRQLQRSSNVELAQTLATELAQADLTNAQLLSELFKRLDFYFSKLASRVELIPTTTASFDIYEKLLITTELDRDDALILATILGHPVDESAKRAFVTANFRDFEQPPVTDLLRGAGIKQFRTTERVLQWVDPGR
jgi:hypothetical protein